MSYRDLRIRNETDGSEGNALFDAACRYANYLWSIRLPARSILALCRAVYIDPFTLAQPVRQPYAAFAWMLRHYTGTGFLGNPRISFVHQATRMPECHSLKRQRAWAMWYISRAAMPELPPDAEVSETPPAEDRLRECLNENGLPGEGLEWGAAMNLARQGKIQDAGSAASGTSSAGESGD